MILSVHIRRIEYACRIGQWAFIAGTLIVLVAAVRSLQPLPEPAIASTEEHVGPIGPVASDKTLEDLSSIWKRDLRQRLIEPKPEPKPKPKPPPPPPPVKLPKLLATFVERGKSWGLFVNNSGQQRVRAAGNTIDDFTIDKVLPGSARLSRGGKSFDVSAPSNGTKRTSRQQRRRHR